MGGSGRVALDPGYRQGRDRPASPGRPPSRARGAHRGRAVLPRGLHLRLAHRRAPRPPGRRARRRATTPSSTPAAAGTPVVDVDRVPRRAGPGPPARDERPGPGPCAGSAGPAPENTGAAFSTTSGIPAIRRTWAPRQWGTLVTSRGRSMHGHHPLGDLGRGHQPRCGERAGRARRRRARPSASG